MGAQGLKGHADRFTQQKPAFHACVSPVSSTRKLLKRFRATQPIFGLTLSGLDNVITGCLGMARKMNGLEIRWTGGSWAHLDRKSTRLNSSHRCSSYAVFCLKKKICNDF